MPDRFLENAFSSHRMKLTAHNVKQDRRAFSALFHQLRNGSSVVSFKVFVAGQAHSHTSCIRLKQTGEAPRVSLANLSGDCAHRSHAELETEKTMSDGQKDSKT